MAGTTLKIRNDGSIKVEGDFEIVDPDGKKFGLGGRANVALCRCGHSQNSPFCDGSHAKYAFKSAVKAFDLPPATPKP